MYFILIVLMTLIGSIAALNLKKASLSTGVKKLVFNKYFWMGGILYFISALLNIYILRYVDYSVVLPLTSITYIWTMVLSAKILNENITKKKIVGIFAIMIGAIMVTFN
jgi:drug/metabolite transporter (DMT)-like permease